METEKFSSEPRKALKIYNIVWLESPKLDTRYRLDGSLQSDTSPTGLLRAFKIMPTVAGWPSFIARWDEKADTLDIDILDVDDHVKRLFKGGKGGYCGHHRDRILGEQRKFEVKVTLPNVVVCEGIVSFNLLKGVSVGGQLTFSGEVSKG